MEEQGSVQVAQTYRACGVGVAVSTENRCPYG